MLTGLPGKHRILLSGILHTASLKLYAVYQRTVLCILRNSLLELPLFEGSTAYHRPPAEKTYLYLDCFFGYLLRTEVYPHPVTTAGVPSGSMSLESGKCTVFIVADSGKPLSN